MSDEKRLTDDELARIREVVDADRYPDGAITRLLNEHDEQRRALRDANETLARAWDEGAIAGQQAGFYGDRIPPNPYR